MSSPSVDHIGDSGLETRPRAREAPAGPIYIERKVSDQRTPEVHSATMVQLPSGELRAYWYGGTREGSRDTAIYTATLDASPQSQWRPSRMTMDLVTTQAALDRFIKKLGNPVAAVDEGGRVWLIYVSVSVGGWAGSALNVAVSDDGGKRWSRIERLITSPFFNVSTLVKGNPVPLQDGGFMVPVYHEFIGKFGEVLYLDSQAKVRDKVRLSWGEHSLQPLVIPYSPERAVALMRYAGKPPKRVLITRTGNAGKGWVQPSKLELPNPDSALAGARTVNGNLVMVLNNSEEERDVLSLAISEDRGKSWRVVHDFENGQGRAGDHRYSYPYLIRSSDGHFHLAYTWNRQYIKHIEFNQAWLESVK